MNGDRHRSASSQGNRQLPASETNPEHQNQDPNHHQGEGDHKDDNNGDQQ